MILSKIKIHPLFYFVVIISLLTGHFRNLLIFTSLIIIHEIGHILTGLVCKWEIDKITLLPFGGITSFDTRVNKSIIDEAFIAISGPVFQCIYFFLFKDYLIKEYHIYLLIFNLIPIYPLDGYKIFKLLLYMILPFKLTNYLSLIIGFIIGIILIISYHNFIFILIIGLLIVKGTKEYKKQPIIFNKFLLERYMYNLSFKKIKVIKKISSMYYHKSHLFKTKNKLITEKEYLYKMFDNRQRI